MIDPLIHAPIAFKNFPSSAKSHHYKNFRSASEPDGEIETITLGFEPQVVYCMGWDSDDMGTWTFWYWVRDENDNWKCAYSGMKHFIGSPWYSSVFSGWGIILWGVEWTLSYEHNHQVRLINGWYTDTTIDLQYFKSTSTASGAHFMFVFLGK